MGYFSNGTEGLNYEIRYCDKCIYMSEVGCPVWDLHYDQNYDQVNDPDLAGHLNFLIPRSEDKLYNEQCTCFREGKHAVGMDADILY